MKTYKFRKSLIIAGAIFVVVLAALALWAQRLETKLAEGFCALVMLGAVIYMASARYELDDEKLTFRAAGVSKVFPWGEITSLKRFQEGKRPAILEVKTKENTLLIQWTVEKGQELMDEIQKRVPTKEV